MRILIKLSPYIWQLTSLHSSVPGTIICSIFSYNSAIGGAICGASCVTECARCWLPAFIYSLQTIGTTGLTKQEKQYEKIEKAVPQKKKRKEKKRMGGVWCAKLMHQLNLWQKASFLNNLRAKHLFCVCIWELTYEIQIAKPADKHKVECGRARKCLSEVLSLLLLWHTVTALRCAETILAYCKAEGGKN